MDHRFHAYTGVGDPRAAVEAELRPVMRVLRDWSRRYHPGREQFWAIVGAEQALDDLARALTGEPLSRAADGYGAGPPGRPD